MIEQVTPVPNAPDYLEGVVLSRGQIVPVLNLRARFGFEKAPLDLATRLLVLQCGERWVGLLVDSAREFVKIPSAVDPAAGQRHQRLERRLPARNRHPGRTTGPGARRRQDARHVDGRRRRARRSDARATAPAQRETVSERD